MFNEGVAVVRDAGKTERLEAFTDNVKAALVEFKLTLRGFPPGNAAGNS